MKYIAAIVGDKHYRVNEEILAHKELAVLTGKKAQNKNSKEYEDAYKEDYIFKRAFLNAEKPSMYSFFHWIFNPARKAGLPSNRVKVSFNHLNEPVNDLALPISLCLNNKS